jgi:hypothetical protein
MEKQRLRDLEGKKNAEVCNFMANALGNMMKKKTSKVSQNRELRSG